MMKICPKCHKEFSNEQGFCGNCGVKLEMKPRFCKKCGTQLNENDQFCPQCGAKTSDDVLSQVRDNIARAGEVVKNTSREVLSEDTVEKVKNTVENAFSEENREKVKGAANGAVNLTGLDLYYQKEFQKIYETGETYKGKFNWWAFFFHNFWLLYKGLWRTVLVLMAVNFIIGFIGGLLFDSSIIANAIIIFSAALISMLYAGFRGNYLCYRKYVEDSQTFCGSCGTKLSGAGWGIAEWLSLVVTVPLILLCMMATGFVFLVVILALIATIILFFQQYKHTTEKDICTNVIKSWNWSIGKWVLFSVALVAAVGVAMIPAVISFCILLLVMVSKIKKKRVQILQCIGRPGFSIGFIILFAITMSCMAVPSALPTIIGGPALAIISMIFLMVIAIRICKTVALMNDNVRAALPVYLIIITGGLASYMPILSLLMGDFDFSDSVLFDVDESLTQVVPPSVDASTTAMATSDTNTSLMGTGNEVSLSETAKNIPMVNTIPPDNILSQLSMIGTNDSGFETVSYNADNHTFYNHDGYEIAHVQGNQVVDSMNNVIATYDSNTGKLLDPNGNALNVQQTGETFKTVTDVHGNGTEVINGEVFDAKTHERIGNIRKV